jgi:hypothetical protein
MRTYNAWYNTHFLPLLIVSIRSLMMIHIYGTETCSCTTVGRKINVVSRLTVNLIVCAVCKDKELVNTSVPQE